jgi:hypothetical protein
MKIFKSGILLLVTMLLLGGTANISAQDKKEDKKDKSFKSIGGEEHDSSIYGVKLGMDVPTALQTVFVNAKRQPGQEKPDAMKKEGKKKKDIRVLYKDLPKGQLQIVFADGKYVQEMILIYAERKNLDSLRLASSSDIGVALSGQRFDDRYTIGFVDNKKQQKLWWRDEKTADDYQARVSFMSGNILKDGSLWWQTIIQKAVFVKPGDEKNFLEAMNNKK